MAGAIDHTLRKFHASLNVADLDRSIAFYRVLLGWISNPTIRTLVSSPRARRAALCHGTKIQIAQTFV